MQNTTCTICITLNPNLLRDICRRTVICRLAGHNLGIRQRVAIPVGCSKRVLGASLHLSLLMRGVMVVRLGSMLRLGSVFCGRLLACLHLASGQIKCLVGFGASGVFSSVGHIIAWFYFDGVYLESMFYPCNIDLQDGQARVFYTFYTFYRVGGLDIGLGDVSRESWRGVVVAEEGAGVVSTATNSHVVIPSFARVRLSTPAAGQRAPVRRLPGVARPRVSIKVVTRRGVGFTFSAPFLFNGRRFTNRCRTRFQSNGVLFKNGLCSALLFRPIRPRSFATPRNKFVLCSMAVNVNFR